MSQARTATNDPAGGPTATTLRDADDRGEPVGLSREGFQGRIEVLLQWLADRDPERAARLVGDYLDDLADELRPAAPQAT